MKYETLDLQICNLIDQYKKDTEETISSATLDHETASCLSELSVDTITVLNNIRMAVSDYFEKK